MKVIKILFRYLAYIIILSMLLTGLFLLYFTLTDYQPPSVEVIQDKKLAEIPTLNKNEFSFITWNIGYCGLDRSMDFFYDGGKNVRPAEIVFQNNLNGIFTFLSQHDSVDFILLQEVDSLAKRSYFTGEISLLAKALPNHVKSFATNFNVKFVPQPLLKPMGEVISGILSFSRPLPYLSERYSFPVNFSWPMRLFMLDRCFLMQRFALKNGHDLLVINTHNSAFVNAYRLRQYEMWMLRNFILHEYAKGNFVIAGGDWNQTPPDYDNMRYYSGYYKKKVTSEISEDFLPEDWNWAYDAKVPTNRDVNESYRPGYTPTTTYDFFVTSPNVMVESVKTISNGFEFSDHQPVYMRIRLDDNPLLHLPKESQLKVDELQDSLQLLKNNKTVK